MISPGVWLYYRFCLSYREVEELLFVRGITVSYEAIRKWCRKFGQQYANQLRHWRPQAGDRWHLNEVSLTPTRQRERRMQGFKSPGHAQRFLPAYGPIAQHFHPRRHRLPAPEYRQELAHCFQMWQEITGAAIAA
jgi:transposase-like protein